MFLGQPFPTEALCVMWSMKSLLFSLKQIEMIHGGKSHRTQGLCGSDVKHQAPELL